MADKEFGMSDKDRKVAEIGAFRGIYESGNPTALHEALNYCQRQNIALPD